MYLLCLIVLFTGLDNMKLSDVYLILSGAYLAPALPTLASIIFSVLFLMLGVIASRMSE